MSLFGLEEKYFIIREIKLYNYTGLDENIKFF